jgi:putative membrane protein
MAVAAMIMAVIVALEHFFILWLEMFNADSEMASQAFSVPRKLLQDPTVQTLLGNQGLYNGFLAVGILFSLFVVPAAASTGVTLFFLACVMVAAVYGSATASKSIIVIQGLPALIAFILVYLA